MTIHPSDSDYVPISCEFHDLLEDLATLRKLIRILYRDNEGVQQQRDATIADVYSRAGAEYALLSSGETLRLDQLVEIDGEKLSDY
jgi:Rho-binding antiterminator